MVVPTLAPMITAIDCAKVINPVLAYDTAIIVTAEDDCTSAVTPSPVSIHDSAFPVMADCT